MDRVYRDMEEAGLPEPVYRQSEFMLYATLKNKNWGKEDASRIPSVHDSIHDNIHDENKLLEFCATPKTRRKMMSFLGLANRSSFAKHYLKPLLESGKLVMTIPDKPRSKNQKYVKK